MEHQKLLMKAMRDFATADPENCEQEWDAYLALLHRKGPVSPSTSSTSRAHHRAPAAAATAPAATWLTAPLHAPSEVVSTTTSAATASTSTSTSNLKSATSSVAPASSDIITRDDLSPGARRLYDYLIGTSTTIDPVHDAGNVGAADLAASAPTTCSTKYPSHGASVYAAELDSSATATSTALQHVQSSVVPSGGILEPAPAKPTPSMDLHTVAPSTCSKLGPDNITGLEDHVDVPQDLCIAPMSLTAPLKDSPSPPCASLDGFNLVFMSPTCCSRKCLEEVTSFTPTLASPATVSTSSAFTAAPPATVSVTSTGPAAGDLLKCGDDVTSPAPFNVAVVVPVTTIKVMTTTLCPAKPSIEQNLIGVESLHTPWNPPRCVIFRNGNRRKGLPEAFHFDGFVLNSTQLMLWVAKSPWPPPQSYKSTSWRIINLHGTLDTMQPLGDWQILKTVKVNLLAALLVILFAPGVQSAQLHPTVFDWSVCSCYDTHLLSDSSNLGMKLELILARQATYTEWVLLYYRSPRVQIQWIITVQRYTSSSLRRKYHGSNLFLVILSGETEVQQHHSCSRVLTVDACKVWNSHHIWRGSSHYPKLHWSFSHSILHSEVLFYTPGRIFFYCCALVQWKIPWTITLILLGYRFQYYHARSVFLYSCEKFQWTIAWFLCYHPSVSIAWLFSCPLLVKLVELKSWPYLSYQISSSVSWSCSCQQLGGLLDLVEGKPRTSRVYLWASYLGTSCGPDIIFMWLQLVITGNLSPKAELLSNITIELKPWPSWELFPCNSAVTSCLRVASHILASSVLFLKGLCSISRHYLEVHILDALLIRLSTPASLHSQELYWLLRVYCSCYQFVTEGTTYVRSELVDWQIPWYFNTCHTVSSSNCLQMQPIDDHWKFNFALLFSWDVSSTIDSVPANHHIPVAVLLLSSGMSTTLAFYLPVARVMQCRSKMMPWGFANSNDGILTCATRKLISWDPGGLDHILAAALSITQLSLHFTWDPGGYMHHRLEDKPNFKEGGLSATCCLVGRYSWAWPALKTSEPLQIQGRARKTDSAGNGPELDGGFGRGLAWRVLRVCLLPSFLLRSPPSSSMFL